MDDKKAKKAETSEEKEIRRKEAAEKLKQKKFEQVVKEGGIIWGVC